MSTISDEVTITGDGTTTLLATIHVDSIASMQSYNGHGTVIQVSDSLAGGTFCYNNSQSYTASFSYSGATITGISFTSDGFAAGQLITVQGTHSNDGVYVIKSVTSSRLSVTPSFITEDLSAEGITATIRIFPYEADLVFTVGGSGTGTIADLNPAGNLLNQAYQVSQNIIITGTSYNDGLYSISAISPAITVTPDFAQNETAPATIMYTNSVYNGSSGALTFSSPSRIGFPGPVPTGLFTNGQTIAIQGTVYNDGVYVIEYVNPTDIIITTVDLVAEGPTTALTITGSNQGYSSNTFGFNLSGTAPVAINDSANHFNLYGFSGGQTVQVSGSKYNDGLYTIDNIIVPTSSTLTIKSGFASETTLSTVTIADNGTVFPATGKGAGCWERQFNTADGLNVCWFGALGNALHYNAGEWFVDTAHTIPAQNDTIFIQRALYSAISNSLHIKKVVFSPGQFLHSTIYLPTGILLSGASMPIGIIGSATTKLVMARFGGDSIRLLDDGVYSSVGTRFGHAGIMYLDFLGEPLNSTGWAISFRNAVGIPIKLEDMNFCENIFVRGYPQGGIEIPNGGVPVNIQHVRGTLMDGPVIYLHGGIPGDISQSVNFDNVSADHSTGGAIWIDSVSSDSNVIITNLKSEQGDSSAYYPNQYSAQVNPIIVTNSLNASIIVDNANHINSATQLGVALGTLSFSGASPGVITITSNMLSDGTAVKFTSTGTLPTNLSTTVVYYVVNSHFASGVTTFQVALSAGGSPVDTSVGTPSGVASLLPGANIKPGDLISVEQYLGLPKMVIGYASITIASATGLAINDQVKFYSTGNLPASLIAGQIYYVVNSIPVTGDIYTIDVAESLGGTAITNSGTQSGTHSIYKKTPGTNPPKITWRGAAFRVRTTDVGVDPQIISLTGIPYTVSEGKFNIVENIFNSKIINLSGSTLGLAPSTAAAAPFNIPVGIAPSSPSAGDMWFDGSNLYFNNTIVSQIPFIDTPEQPYVNSITWTGTTAPSGTTSHTYQWTKVGKMVTVRFNLLFGTAGAGLTGCTMPFPGDLPTPYIPSGFSTVATPNPTIYTANVAVLTTVAGGTGTSRGDIHFTSVIFELQSFFSSSAVIALLATVNYWTA